LREPQRVSPHELERGIRLRGRIVRPFLFGQTNTSAATPLGFSVPPLRLRGEWWYKQKTVVGDRVDKPAPTISLSTPAALATPAVALQSSLGDAEFSSRVIRSGEFYLTRAEPPADSGVVRFVEGIFTPEVIHLGKSRSRARFVTAIKRKNPLCLLNPLVFQVSW
jgi:hypothetical protein